MSVAYLLVIGVLFATLKGAETALVERNPSLVVTRSTAFSLARSHSRPTSSSESSRSTASGTQLAPPSVL